MLEVRRPIVEILSLAATLATIIGGIIAVIPYILSRRKKNRDFLKIGDFINASELTEKKLSDSVKEKFLKLLKHDSSDWHEYYLWSDRNDTVLKMIEERGKSLIIGVSGIGKSRLVIEVLRKLAKKPRYKDMVIIAVDKNSNVGKRPIIKKSFWRKWKTICLIFDDLEQYIGNFNLLNLILEFKRISEDVIIIATCRREEFATIETNSDVTTIFSRRDRFEVSLYNFNQGKKIAKGIGKQLPKDFVGTADQIVLETIKKREYYQTLKENEKDLLRAVKLLKSCRISSPQIKHVLLVWTEIFHGHGNWNSCLHKIVSDYNFFQGKSLCELERVLIPDVYVIDERGIVCDYPSYKGQLIEHARILRKLLKKAEASDELFNLGIFFNQKNISSDAINCFDDALKIDSRHVDAWFNKGLIFFKIDKPQEANRCYNEALAIKSNRSDIWFNKGTALSKLGKTADAIHCYKKAIDLKPNDPDVWFGMEMT